MDTLMIGDVVTILPAYGKGVGGEWEVLAYNYTSSCESHMMIAVRKLQGTKKLILDRNWFVFSRAGICFDDDIPF